MKSRDRDTIHMCESDKSAVLWLRVFSIRVAAGGVVATTKEGRRERSERWSCEISIRCEHVGWPVRAPCLMRRSQFPDTCLPSGCLRLYNNKSYNLVRRL